MEKKFLFLLTMVFAVQITMAQEVPIEKIVKDEKSLTNSSRSELSYNVLTLTAMVPVGFSRIEKHGDSYQIGNTISLGLGATLILGKIVYKAEEEISEVKPLLFIGLSFDVGAREDAGDMNLAFLINGYLGTGEIGVCFGYDFLSDTSSLGVALKIDSFKFVDSLYAVIAKWKNK